ncbi:DUF4190 domain-containing protein [Streptomyces sp. NPDC058122]|uniref:DUF4190 domain-containing protein n=1 Tax=Streptomyces sp. NPDC058122 TaxID=3346349 RepID=UPI0036E6FB7D
MPERDGSPEGPSGAGTVPGSGPAEDAAPEAERASEAGPDRAIPTAGSHHAVSAAGPDHTAHAAGPGRTAPPSDGGRDDGPDRGSRGGPGGGSGGGPGGGSGGGPVFGAEETARWADRAFDDGAGHAAPPTGGAFGAAPAGSVPAQGTGPFAAPGPDARVSLGKPDTGPRSEFDPWAPPEEIASPGRTVRGSGAPPPAYGLPTITSLPGAPAPPGPGNPGGPWDNPFAPPAARTPYPQPSPGEPVPPPPIAPGGPGLPYGHGYPQYPGFPAGAAHPGAPGYGWPLSRPMPSNGLGTAGLVLGIIAAVLFIVWPLAIVLGVLAVIFGLVGGAKARRGEATNAGQALAGVICGAVGLVLAVAVFVLIVVYAPDDGGGDTGGDDGFSTSLVTRQVR